MFNKRKIVLASFATLTALLPAAPASAEPPSFDDYVESQTYPIRVHYPLSVGQGVANQALGYAETAWRIQIEQMGFPVPNTVDDNDDIVPGMWIYLDPTAGYNHAEAIGDNPNTPWTDCTVRTIVASTAPADFFELVIGHEMNHALEMTSDCGESPFAYENTTMAVSVLMDPQTEVFKEWLPTFQQYPHHGIDCAFFSDMKKRFYHYGASLFQLYLEQVHGNYDGTLLASIWEAAKQEGNVIGIQSIGVLDVPNDPNLMDAIEAVLPDVSFDEAFSAFARWRYFVGARDDGAHFNHGASWAGSEVWIDTEHTLAELPVLQAEPGIMPNDYGTVYVGLSLLEREANTGITLGFEGDPGVSWNVDVLLVRPDGSAETRTLDTTSTDHTLLLDGLDGFAKAVLVVSNLSDGNHDPNAFVCGATASFSYSLELTELSDPADPVDPVDPNDPVGDPPDDAGGAQTVAGCGCELADTTSGRSGAGWPALLAALTLVARRRRLRPRP
jgi:MYXO-CTERM domain-containing protein